MRKRYKINTNSYSRSYQTVNSVFGLYNFLERMQRPKLSLFDKIDNFKENKEIIYMFIYSEITKNLKPMVFNFRNLKEAFRLYPKWYIRIADKDYIVTSKFRNEEWD